MSSPESSPASGTDAADRTVRPEVVRQLLEDWQRAGIKSLPIHLHPPQQSAPPKPAQRQPASQPGPAPGGSRSVTPLSPGRLDLLREHAEAKTPPSPAAPTEPAASSGRPIPIRTLPMIDGKNLSCEERQKHLDKLSGVVSKCVRCKELAETRTQTVFGVGNPEARIMFLGEAPGADEDKQGEPFVGRAGQLLNKIMEASQLKREDVYICNILRCRPPGNRNPSATESANCREYLDGQIALVDPEYIICLGTVAAQNLLDTKTPIGRMRKKFHEFEGRKVMCTYHPSYLLRNPSAKKDVWEDMQMFMADLGIDLGEH